MSDEPVDVSVEDEIEISEQQAGTEVGDLQEMVDDLIVRVHEAKSIPLSGNAMVDRDKILGLLEKINAALPDELKAARWMVREREAFIARTNEKARGIVEKARNEADELVANSNILAESVEEANMLVRRAEGEARRLRLETEDEIEKKLQIVEGLLVETMAQIQAARNEFHQARPKPPDVPL